MMLKSHSVAPNTVREEQRDGDRYLVVEDVPFVRAMRLSGGYVPAGELERSAEAWGGRPLTVNHPRDERGEPVPANQQLAAVGVGIAESPRFDPDHDAVRADLAINADRAEAMGGEAADIVAAIESGEPFDVSSQYVPRQLPAGEYDGGYRGDVEGIAQPDSIALLPNKQGECSIEEGCGIDPQLAANSNLTIPMLTTNADAEFDEGDLVRWQTQAAPGTGRVAEVVTEPGETVESEADTENPAVRRAAEDEPVYKLDNWDARSEEYVAGQVVKSESELLGEWDDAPEAARTANAAGGATGADDGSEPEDPDADTDPTANQMEMALTDVGADDVDEFTDEPWDGAAAIAEMPNPSESDDAGAALDASHLLHPVADDARDDKSNWKLPFRRGPEAPVNTRALVAAEAALSGARDGVEDVPQADRDGARARIDDFLVAAPNDLFGSREEDGEMSDNTLDALMSFLTGGDSGGDGGERRAGTRDDMIDDLVDHTDLKRKSLEPMGDNCLRSVWAERMTDNTTTNMTQTANRTDGDGGGSASVSTEMLMGLVADALDVSKDDLRSALDDLVDGNAGRDKDMTDNTNDDDRIVFESREAFEEEVREVVSDLDAQDSKQELAGEIAANSAEYDDADAVLDDFPTEAALETKREQVSGGAAVPSANASGLGDGVSPTDSADIDMDDISSGVLD